jgi:hypothetical protein
MTNYPIHNRYYGHAKTPEERREYAKQYYRRNREWLNSLRYEADKERYATDPEYRKRRSEISKRYWVKRRLNELQG